MQQEEHAQANQHHGADGHFAAVKLIAHAEGLAQAHGIGRGLPGLQSAYGGFRFADVKLFEIGLKYKALSSGAVDVVVAFGTDGQIDVDHLVVFEDDKHFWPAYQVAPVVRAATLATYPAIATHLDRLAPRLTDSVMRGLNAQVDGQKKDPADVAAAFLRQNGFA